MGDEYNGPTTPYNADSEQTLLRKIAKSLNDGGEESGGSGVSQGKIQLVPAGTTNGVALPNRPAATRGVLFRVAPGGSVDFYFDTIDRADTAAPTTRWVDSVPGDSTRAVTFAEYASNPDTIYIVSANNASFKWIA